MNKPKKIRKMKKTKTTIKNATLDIVIAQAKTCAALQILNSLIDYEMQEGALDSDMVELIIRRYISGLK